MNSLLKKYGILFFSTLFTITFFIACAQDTNTIKVQFIYGSKPLRKFRDTEKKWFGGLLGGHAGIEISPGKFLSFEGNDKFHPIDHRYQRHCRYRVLSTNEFWNAMGSSGDSVKKATISIPVNHHQINTLDSLAAAYVRKPPYDYSFFGMRCASATYEVLGQLGLVKPHSYRGTCLRIFYPKQLRKQLMAQAQRKGWTVIKQEGSTRRKWETF